MTVRTPEYLNEEYNVKMRSVEDIAKEHNTYPNKIRRELIKYGYSRRGKSEAQSAALASGRTPHPTKGKERDDDVKERIGRGVYDTWEQTDEVEKDRRSKYAKEQWKNMSAEQKGELNRLASVAVRKTSKEGSKMERFLLEKFHYEGIPAEPHKTDLTPYTALEVDIYLPSYNTVIEVDGPSHFRDIWGEGHLEKQKRADSEKNGIVTAAGMVMIRVRIDRKHISKTFQEEVFAKLFDVLSDIILKTPLPIEQRLIYLEV